MIEQTLIPTESKYDGNSDDYGRRNGLGIQSWQQEEKEQKYNGQFFQDCMHGEGLYEWTKGKEKVIYEGNFYSNAKEGYGVVSLQNKAIFEGLFCNNRPFGPGILTYENGRQDAGFWVGTKIVRLSRVVDYIIPRLASSLDGKIKLFPYRRILYLQEEFGVPMEIFGTNNELASHLYSSFLSDCRSLFFNRINYDKVYFKNLKDFHPNDLVDDSRQLKGDGFSADEIEMDTSELQFLHKENLTSRNDEHDKALENDSSLKLVCWNRSELCAEIVKQIFHFRSFEGKLSFKISNLIEGNRMTFKKTGYKEKECIHFLKTCSVGPSFVIKEFLCSFKISEELMDARGNNSLMFAAANDQHEIIDILLDHGVDVDSFNDEHLTALNLCLLRLIAQTYKILNWEIAFLPPKMDDEEYDETKGMKYKGTCSIKSLDRIFGDGMSLIESEIDLNLVEIKSVEGEDCTNFDSDLDFKKNKCKSLESVWKMVPILCKMDEYLDSVAKPTGKDKYFFDLSPAPAPSPPTPPLAEKKKRKGKPVKEAVVEEVLTVVEEEPENEEKLKKCENIEQTIRKLLERGADPNLSEVPKPSVHLGVFARSVNVVNTLLMFGASVNARGNLNEGFLTPLHIVVLIQPAEEFVDICKLLLEYGADPEAETTPEFNPNCEREIFLNSKHGRTPLQLLCMRPDFEYADPKGYLLDMALLLLQMSNAKHRYRGYNYLTLAMLRGNVKLVEAFLKSGRFDPNEVLKTHGTPLHVLVSTFLQVRVPFEESLKICDLLLDFGANPLKKWRQGCCVEYGGREIEKEKESRKSNKGKDKSKGRDHLQDHVKIVEYLRKRAKIVAEEVGVDFEKEVLQEKEVPGKIVKEAKKIDKEKSEVEEKDENVEKKLKEGKRKREGIVRTQIEDEKEKKFGGSRAISHVVAAHQGRITRGDDGKTERESKEASERIQREDKKELEVIRSESIRKKSENVESGELDKSQSVKNVKSGEAGKSQIIKNEVDKLKKEYEEEKDENGRFDELDKAQSKTLNENMKRKREISSEAKKKLKKSKESKKVVKSKPPLPLKKLPKPRKKFDRIPESLQHLLYDILGNCRNVFNLNDLLLPYVVLRNGDLYYRFKGQKPKNTEAYSLI